MSEDTVKYIDHLGVYGVILDASHKNMLLVHKSRGPFTEMWDLPGGKPEFHETFEDTLSREVYEETREYFVQSRQITCMLNVFQWGDIWFRHTGIIYVCEVDYTCQVAGTAIKSVPDGHDSNGCSWFRIDEIQGDRCTPFVNRVIALKEYE